MRILFATGGSGGHIYPVVAIARAVADLATQAGKEVEMEIIGSSRFFTDISDLNIPIRRTWDAKARNYFSFLNFLDVVKLPFIFFQSLFYVWRFMPDLVFAKGGYASYMPALIARIFFIPIYIHESDSIPGKANRALAKHVKKIFISFESSASYFDASKTQLVGDPIRTELMGGNRSEAIGSFQFTETKPVLLISGGSQGADKINTILKESLVELIGQFQIIHQCGSNLYKAFNDIIQQIIKEGESSYGKQIQDGYRLYPFLGTQELTMAYAASDVIVNRAGSASLFEIATLGKPGIIIPITNSANNHQINNAIEFAKFGGKILEEENLTTQVFIKEIQECYEHRAELAQQIKSFARPDAAQLIAQQLLM